MSNKAAQKYASRLPNPATSTTEEYLDGEAVAEIFNGSGEWVPTWAPIQFDGDACLKNVHGAGSAADGYFAPAGTILPLGASFPEMTVLKYGGYFPAGTAFPGGILTPVHARMVNLLPQETTEPAPPSAAESMCLIQ